MSTDFWGPGKGPPQRWDLKYGSMSVADWLWLVIVPILGLKTILDMLDTAGIAYAHHTRGDYMG